MFFLLLLGLSDVLLCISSGGVAYNLSKLPFYRLTYIVAWFWYIILGLSKSSGYCYFKIAFQRVNLILSYYFRSFDSIVDADSSVKIVNQIRSVHINLYFTKKSKLKFLV